MVCCGVAVCCDADRGRGAANQPRPGHSRRQQVHHLVIQVTDSDPAVMNLALSNAVNVAQHYSEFGEEVEIEIVAYGPGLHMLRDDTSPVKARLKSMAEKFSPA